MELLAPGVYALRKKGICVSVVDILRGRQVLNRGDSYASVS